MDLKTFISSPDRKRLLAAAVGASEGYLWQVATGWRGKKASAELAVSIEIASRSISPECAVHRHDLRPDLWLPPVAANDDAGDPAPTPGHSNQPDQGACA